MPEIALSLILPAFDEARRLPPYLENVRSYLEQVFRQPYEVIVVDDGSRDETAAVVQCMASQWPQLRLLRHAQNEGKGSAVRTGVLAARGELFLFADADGATPIEEHARLAAAVAQGADVAIGSRLAPDTAIRRSRDWYRGLAGKLFALAARRLVGNFGAGYTVRIQDVPCRCRSSSLRDPARKPVTCSTWNFSSWPGNSACAWSKCRFTGRKCRAGISIRSANCPGSSPAYGDCGGGNLLLSFRRSFREYRRVPYVGVGCVNPLRIGAETVSPFAP